MTDKATMLRAGIELMQEFCETNKLAEPNINEVPKDKWRFTSTCAYYREDVITIAPSACAFIGYGGRAWSYPGYVIDRTPYGVVQHELGHHVDFSISGEKGAYGGDFSERLRAATGEKQITSYVPNDWEWFAEIFRLYVTNSDLLKRLRPATYKVLRDLYRPVVDKPWRTVLKHAPQRTVEQAAIKIANR